jgi:hypothetical protein
MTSPALKRQALEILRAAVLHEVVQVWVSGDDLIDAMVTAIKLAAARLSQEVDQEELAFELDELLEEIGLAADQDDHDRYMASLRLQLIPGRPPTKREMIKKDQTGSFYDSQRLQQGVWRDEQIDLEGTR